MTLVYTFQLFESKLWIHDEIWMVEDIIENVKRWLCVWVEQRLGCDAVCQQKDDA